jgi:4-hydroxybenzoyl-CoA reductase subunit beta
MDLELLFFAFNSKLYALSSMLLETSKTMNNMRLPKFSYHEPATLGELLSIKQELKQDCLFIAGGTDLLPMLKRRNRTAPHILNIKRIPELKRISHSEQKGLHIGCAVTLREVIDHPVVSKKYPVLAQAAGAVGFNQLRNMATLGGNVCLDNKCSYFNQSAFWWKSRPDCFKRGGDQCYVVKGGKECFSLSAADTVSALMVLEAELVICGPENERRVPIADFYTGNGQMPHDLREDELVSAIVVPPDGGGWKQGFLKKSARGCVDFAVASLSVCLKMKGPTVEDARIALNGVSTKPVRPTEAENYLKGKRIDEATVKRVAEAALKEIKPLSLIGASAFLRRHVIRAMFQDVTEKLIAD